MDTRAITDNNDSLFSAYKRGDAAAVEQLLRQRPHSVYAKARDGQTALHFAVSHGHAYVTRLLIEAGADVNARNRVGLSPLHLALGLEEPRTIVSTLLAHGSDVQARDNAAYTPLHYAAARSAAADAQDVLEMLLDAGADVDAVNQKGETVLHLAALSLQKVDGGEDVVRLLITRGARTDAVDKAGHRPVDYQPASEGVRDLLRVPEVSPKAPLRKRSALRGVGARPRGAARTRTVEVDPQDIEEALHPSPDGEAS